MNELSKAGLVIAGTLGALALGAGVFIGSGVYDIGADDHHTKVVLAIIGQLRERSIGARARTLAVPDLETGASIAAGARRYAALCAGCHLAPGVTRSALRPGLYPHPPNLAQEAPREARNAFWTIKHGIKMSAMPAWGKTLDDAAIWDIVSFMRKMPAMDAQAYQLLAQEDRGIPLKEPPGAAPYGPPRLR
ncbi:MAG: c-type cytochrome [Steroidobacteraceae bacterium]